MTKANALRDMNVDELVSRADELYRSIFNLRIRASTKELENVTKIRAEKRELARVKTVLREKGVKI
jgi:large subunit ribosomal protein L29